MLEFKVENMTCGHCVAAVTGALRGLDPAAEVRADLGQGRVSVTSAVPAGQLAAAIEAAGYPARLA